MRTLQVENFSCIKAATLEIDRLTLIIGPQASGKSVLGKLSFFAIDIGLTQHVSIVRGDNFEKFVQTVKQRFVEWFPVEAWGPSKFKIRFSAGDYSLAATRKSYKGVSGDDFRLQFSDAFQANYEELAQKIEKRSTRNNQSEVSDELERDWQLQDAIRIAHRKLQGLDAVDFQAFVPAGRSFFTSIGKAIAAFEQGRVLDPLILRFGRLYTAYKDRQRRFYNEPAQEREARKAVETLLSSLLGGTLQRDGDREYLHTPDGRKVPLSALSSGQQELLPIITFLPWLSGARTASLCYIEEPEAHLFPTTQSRLVQGLVMIASSSSLVMTTHSPYVLTKVNNLLKAGNLGKKLGEPLRKELEAMIPRRAWLTARGVRAYAIKDGTLLSILGRDGLIDGEYLDEISSELSNEFSSLLDLEERNA